MSHTSLVKTSTTKGRGAKSRGEGRGNTQNRRSRDTYDDSTIQQSSQNSQSDNLDHCTQENRESPRATRGYHRQNRGQHNQRYFKLDNFSGSNESERSEHEATGSGDSNRLPKHASNPIFVHELVHRFSSILPKSDLLEPEHQQRDQQRDHPNARRFGNNVFPNERVEYCARSCVNNSRDSCYNENPVRRYANEGERSNNNIHREKEGPHQSEQYHTILSRGNGSIRNHNTGDKRKLNKPHENKKQSLSPSISSESSTESARKDPKRRFSDDHKNKEMRKDEYGISNNKPSNSNSGVTEFLTKSHTGPHMPFNKQDFRIADDHKNKETGNDKDGGNSKPRNSNSEVTKVLTKSHNGPYVPFNEHDFKVSDNQKNRGTRNDKDGGNSNYRTSSSEATELLNKSKTGPHSPSVNRDLEKREHPHENREDRFTRPGTQERMNMLMKYGFKFPTNKENTNDSPIKMTSPSSLNAPPQSHQEPFSASTGLTLGTQLFAEIDRFESGLNKQASDSNPQKDGSPKKPLNAPNVTSQQTPLAAPTIGAQFIDQVSLFDSRSNKLITNSNSNKDGNPEKNNSPNLTPQETPFVPTPGAQFVSQVDRFFGLLNTAVPDSAPKKERWNDSNPQKDENPKKPLNAPNLTSQQTPLAAPTLGETPLVPPRAQFVSQVDRFFGLLNTTVPDSAPKKEQDLHNFKDKTSKSVHQPIIGSNQNKINTDNGKNMTQTKPNQSQQTSLPFNLAGQIDNYNAFLSESICPVSNNKQLNSGQNHRHPIRCTPSTSTATCEGLALTGQGVSGAGPFNIVRPLADHNQVPVRRSDALNRLQQEYEIKLREHEEKEKQKLEKKRQEKLKKYNHVDNGHQGYRLSEGFLDEAAGYAPGIAQFLESEEDVRERQQLQLQIDAIVYKEREEKELQLKKKREEEKCQQKLAKNKHIDAGYQLGFESSSASGIRPVVESQEDVREKQQQQLKREALIHKEEEQKELQLKKKGEEERIQQQLAKNKHIDAGYQLGFQSCSASGIRPVVESQEDVREKQQQQMKREALIRKEKEQKEREIQQKKDEERKRQRLEETKFIEAGHILGSTPLLGASRGDTMVEESMMTDQDLLTQEEDRLRQEAIFFQEQARLAEKRLAELAKRRKKNGEETKLSINTSNATEMAQNSTPDGIKEDHNKKNVQEANRQKEESEKGSKEGVKPSKPPSSNSPGPSPPTSGSKDYIRDRFGPGKLPPRLVKLREANRLQQQLAQQHETLDIAEVNKDNQGSPPLYPANGPTGVPPVLKLPQNMFKTVLNDILQPVQMEPMRQTQTNSEQVKHARTPASCVLNSSMNGPVLVLRPSTAALQRAVAGRVEIQDEVDKQGHSALYAPNVHPEPEFIHNKFDTSLTLTDGNRSTGAIPKKIAKPQKKTEPPTTPVNHELNKADIVCPVEHVIDHLAEMRAARLRMQVEYEQQLKHDK